MTFEAHSIPFKDHLGIQVISSGDGHAHLFLPFSPALTNMEGVLHGGALMTALDIVMAYAAGSMVPNARNAVTIDMQVQFMKPGTGDLHAWGEVTRMTRNLAFCEGRLLDSEEEIVAKGQGLFKPRI